MCDALTVAEQPCCLGRSLKLRHKDWALAEPLLEEFGRHTYGIGAAGHGGLPWTLRGSRPMRDDAALINWQRATSIPQRGFRSERCC
jgi:hypothetical protein